MSWDDDLKKLNADVDTRLKAVSKKIYNSLMEVGKRDGGGGSPVWTGSYLVSHRISVDNAYVRPPTYRFDIPHMDKFGIIPPKISLAEEIALREEMKGQLSIIDGIKGADTVTFLNRIGHREIVEEGLDYQTYARAELAGWMENEL